MKTNNKIKNDSEKFRKEERTSDVEIITITNAEDMLQMFQNVPFVMEGLDMDSIPDFMDYLNEIGEVYRRRVFVASGEVMNRLYQLEGENKYNNQIHIVFVMLKDIWMNNAAMSTIFELGMMPKYELEYEYSRMEIRRRAKLVFPDYKETKVTCNIDLNELGFKHNKKIKDFVLNTDKKDHSFEFYYLTRPGKMRSPLGISLLQVKPVVTNYEDIEKIYVEDRKILDLFYNEWVITVEGMEDWVFPYYIDFLESRTTVYRKRLYIIKGSTMNREYGLTGTNQYPDDLNLVCISKEDVDQENGTILTDRNLAKGRYFTDIVDNNNRVENGPTEEDKKISEQLIKAAKGVFIV